MFHVVFTDDQHVVQDDVEGLGVKKINDIAPLETAFSSEGVCPGLLRADVHQLGLMS